MICTYLAIINAPMGDSVTIISAHPFITALFTTTLFLHRMPSCTKFILAILVSLAIILLMNQNGKQFGYYMALTAALATSLYNVSLTYFDDFMRPSVLAFWSGLIGIGQCFILTLFVPDLPIMIVDWQLAEGNFTF